MRKAFTLVLTSLLAALTQAQTLNIRTGQVVYAFPASQTGQMTYDEGKTLTVMGRTFDVADITGVYIDGSNVTNNTVAVNYGAHGADITVAGNIAAYVSIQAEGTQVSVMQADTAADTTSGEIIYALSGASDEGFFRLTGTYKATLELHGLALACSTGAPLDIQNGKRISLSVKNGTENTLTDGAEGTQKGCIHCKGHLELKGRGTLNINGKAAHGIYAKEYVEMKNCTVNVRSAVKDGLHCGQYFRMESGTLDIASAGDDGVQVEFKDATDREAEDTGSAFLTGGDIRATLSAKAAKGIKTDGDIHVSGQATVSVATSGGGLWDSTAGKTKAAAGLGADGNITVDGGTLSLTASGSGGKGINCDGTFTVGGGDITVGTTGGLYAYRNGTEYDNYTGNADNLGTNYKSSPKGIKADGDVSIHGGTIRVTTTGNGGEGIESKATLTISGGTVVAKAYDDAINSSSHMYLAGGDITAIASNNDGLDANGNLYVSGGVIRAFGASSPECGIDANEEEGYSVHFTGGILLAVGGGNSVPSSSASTQAYVSGSGSLSAGTTVELKDGTTVLASFTVPEGYSGSSQGGSGGGPGGRPGGGGGWGPGGNSGSTVLITCPGLTKGSAYSLTCGSNTSSVTAALTGSSGGFGRP